ncbi:MAG: hypothetical protein JRF38_12985 [Deltaproteobacteria bacterium]|jgi:hypothetical protein|nr:hypothetical protein [Deltaproteobacteria bacterium]
MITLTTVIREKMKTYHFILWIVCWGSLLTGNARDCLALDEGGCLTCHQYPGLVRLEKDDGFRVLHVDEAKYARSAHGKIDCRQCHTPIHQVPHTGLTAVDCTTHCHQKGKEKEQVKKVSLKFFHDQEQSFIMHLDDKTACRVCHPLYPHSENKWVRAFLNMHTGFMVCDVCHVKKENLPAFTYDWKETENAYFSGEPFGTYFNPKTKTAHKSEHFISRIALFVKNNGKKQLIIDGEDTRKANEYHHNEKNLTPDQKAKGLDYFHRHVAKKEISIACDECHSSHSILDFKQLGFDAIKTNHLVTMDIKGLVTKYQTFYFPELLGK